jgi:hypothetical protein
MERALTRASRSCARAHCRPRAPLGIFKRKMIWLLRRKVFHLRPCPLALPFPHGTGGDADDRAR